MTKKILISMGMALFLLIAQSGAVLAAQEATPITGTVKSVTLETDATTNETTVVVELLLDSGATETVRLSPTTAEQLGLVTTDTATGVVTVNQLPEGTVVEIEPGDVLTDGELEDEEDQHPVGSALADFFSDLLGVDYETIMDYHDEGVGFGVIAQALWMTERLDGDTATFAMILEAKQSGDYGVITLPDGSTPQNWGQFKKAVMGTGGHENLGTVMSDQDNNDNPGQEQKEKNKDSYKNNNGNNNNNNNNGNNNGNRDRNKDKDKNKNKP